MEMEFQIRATKADFNWAPDEIEIFARQLQGKNRFYAEELKFKQSNVGDRVQPFLRIEKCHAQKLMDDLWDCGLRPSEGSGSAGAMKKTEEHLQDMRKIAFHKLGIKEKTNGT